MAKATNLPTNKILEMIGGLYGKGKRREDWVGDIGASKRKSQYT